MLAAADHVSQDFGRRSKRIWEEFGRNSGGIREEFGGIRESKKGIRIFRTFKHLIFYGMGVRKYPVGVPLI